MLAKQGRLETGDYFRHAEYQFGNSKYSEDLQLAFLNSLLDVHIFEFAGFEDVAALDAFDEFSVLIAAHDLNARVFARLPWTCVWLRRRLQSHKSGGVASSNERGARIAEFSGILALSRNLSSARK